MVRECVQRNKEISNAENVSRNNIQCKHISPIVFQPPPPPSFLLMHASASRLFVRSFICIARHDAIVCSVGAGTFRHFREASCSHNDGYRYHDRDDIKETKLEFIHLSLILNWREHRAVERNEDKKKRGEWLTGCIGQTDYRRISTEVDGRNGLPSKWFTQVNIQPQQLFGMHFCVA